MKKIELIFGYIIYLFIGMMFGWKAKTIKDLFFYGFGFLLGMALWELIAYTWKNYKKDKNAKH